MVFLQWTTMLWANGAASDYDTMLRINYSLHSMVNEHYVTNLQVDEIISIFQDTRFFVFWYIAHITCADVLCCCACCLFPVYINCQQGFTCMQDLWLWLSVFWAEWLIMLKLHTTCYYNSVQVFCVKIFLT